MVRMVTIIITATVVVVAKVVKIVVMTTIAVTITRKELRAYFVDQKAVAIITVIGGFVTN